MDYEKEIFCPPDSIKFARLIPKAISNAEKKIPLNDGEILIFEILFPEGKNNLIYEYIAGKKVGLVDDINHLKESNHTRLQIDYRLFFGLMTGIYHWNNAEVGSLISWRRVPKSYYLPEVRKFLNFLTVF